jgi:hypothetical protein
MVERGEITDALSIIAIQRVALLRGKSPPNLGQG